MKILKECPQTFWTANIIELFERWAWYGIYSLFAIYLTGSTDMGALGFTQAQKGTIMGLGTAFLYFLPVITGALADKYGYKKMLILSFLIHVSAFLLFPHFKTYGAVFAMYIFLAIGSAMFKPVITATIAKTTTDKTASIGFGVFYMMINIGGYIGPMVALMLRNNYGSYHPVFYASAIAISVNYILLFFYKEPERAANSDKFSKAMATVFRNIWTAVRNYKFAIFLLLAACFWTMYLQFFYSLPVFISQWVDTSTLYSYFANNMPFFANNFSTNGQMNPEFITNFGPLYIIIFQILVSTFVMRFKPLNAMMAGFLVCAIGLALTFTTQSAIFTIIAILIFALGEMSSSPKIQEYVGRVVAPPDKKALYMGCSFIPVFLGNLFAGFVSGNVYEMTSDKYIFVQKEVAEHGLQISAAISDRTAYFAEAAEQMNLSVSELTNHLWNTYNPSSFWTVVLAIGAFAAFGMFLYDRILLKK
jgi:dipeptide/tripeptide permease